MVRRTEAGTSSRAKRGTFSAVIEDRVEGPSVASLPRDEEPPSPSYFPSFTRFTAFSPPTASGAGSFVACVDGSGRVSKRST
jgi:hypothetical protein